MSRTGRRAGHLLPLDERLRYLRLLRAVLAAATIADAALMPHALRATYAVVGGVAVGYLAVCLLSEAYWRLVGRRGRWLFGSLLAVDGLFLAAASYLTGGTAGSLRYLILVHLAAVTLLASWRTGVKVAIWHSALQFGVFYGERASALHPSGAAESSDWLRVCAFILALWTLAFTISSLAAVNERELRRRRFELEKLARMGRALEDANDALAVGDVLVDTLQETFGFRRMALFEMVEGVPRLLTCRGLGDAVVGDFRVSRGSVLTAAYDGRRTVLLRGLDPDDDAWLSAVMPSARNLMAVPLAADAVIGVLVVELGKARGIERRVVSTTERFAGHAALAIRNANLLERMQQMAVTDGLTQLANRRSFDRALERELQRAERSRGRLSVVLLDIDHFKALNDSHGHLVGDAVLRQVAAALRSSGREYDTIARYGGEEFAAVLPGCSSSVALQVAERLRRAVEDAPTDVAVTASAGVATYPADGLDADSLLEAADRALYASKRAGRNQVRSAEQVRAEDEAAEAS